MDAADRLLLETTVRDALANAGSSGLDDVLADLGWLEMLGSEPRDAVDIVFTALGASYGASTALDDVIVHALGATPSREVCALVPSFATSEPPGTFDGVTVRASGLTSARVVTARELVVACRRDTEVWRVAVPISAVKVSPVRGIDPDAGWHVVQLEHEASTDAEQLDAGAWDAAVAVGRRAVAHQIAGACRAMLDLARTHAIERVQFDRPISRFQAVRHRLADTLVAVEALEASVGAAWDAPGSMTAALAKAIAGRTAATVGANCQQVLAGTGFTMEHPFHRFLKRTIALEGIFGSGEEIEVELGRQLLAAREAPTLIDL